VSTSSEILERLGHALDGADGTGIVSIRLRLTVAPAAIDWLVGFQRAGRAAADERFYWACPAEGVTVLGIGVVRAIGISGAERFRDASTGVRELMAGVSVLGDAGPSDWGPLVLGGFAFGDRPGELEGVWPGFPAARFVLPEILLVRRDDELWLTLTFEDADSVPARIRPAIEALFDRAWLDAVAADPCGFDREGPGGMASGPEYRVQSDRSHADYRAQVDAARRAIAAGDLQKVVLARSLRVQHDGRFDLAGLLRRLARLYPTCVTFAVSRPGVCFLGATPELLVARSGAAVRSGAVAGSSRRGRTPEEDQQLGQDLRESKKEQEEHAVVVRAIAEALASVCAHLQVPEAPRLLRIEGIQHLETPIEGALDETAALPSVIDLAARLHPTPAVGGAPRAAAVAWIERCEGLDRGWYAGPVGFVDREGGGELRVALRSVLVRSHGASDDALLFAGSGVVADSEPDRELEETRIKLRALLAPLTEI
jgi:isochorismate synthase